MTPLSPPRTASAGHVHAFDRVRLRRRGGGGGDDPEKVAAAAGVNWYDGQWKDGKQHGQGTYDKPISMMMTGNI